MGFGLSESNVVGPDPFKTAQQCPGTVDALNFRAQGFRMTGFHLTERLAELIALGGRLDSDRWR